MTALTREHAMRDVPAAERQAEPTHESLYLRYLEKGEIAAFESLVAHYQEHAFRVAVGGCGSVGGLAEEAVQESFAQLARGSSRFADQGPGSFRAFLTQVVLRQARKFRLREQRLQRRQQSENREMVMHASRTEAVEDLSRREVLAGLRCALEDLHEDTRVPIVLHYMNGMSQTEAAGVIGISASAVSRRIAQGLEQLRHRLAQLGLAMPAAALPALLADKDIWPVPQSLGRQLVDLAYQLSAQTAVASRRLIAPAQSRLWIYALAGVLTAAVGGAAFGLMRDGRPGVGPSGASHASMTEDEPDKALDVAEVPYYRRWSFNDGAPGDLKILAREWTWQAPQEGRPAGMLAPKLVQFLLPHTPKRPFKLTAKGYQADRTELMWYSVHHLAGQELLPRKVWSNQVFTPKQFDRLHLWESYVLGPYAVSYYQGNLMYACEFTGNLAGMDFGVVYSNQLLVELEVRELAVDEIPLELRDMDALIAGFGAAPSIKPRKRIVP